MFLGEASWLTAPIDRYDPNVFTINLEQLLSGTPLDSAIGILKVTIESAAGLKAVKLGGGAPDPYVVMGVGLKPAVNKTSFKHSTSHPVWNETHYILVNTLNESLNLSVFDYNEHRADNALGTSVFDLASLVADAEQSGLSSKIVQDGKDRGTIRYNLSFYPVLTPKALPDGTLEPPPESSTGIVRLTIHQAKDLDMSRSSGTLSPYAAVYLGNNQEMHHRTATMKSSNTPTWESSTEFLVPDKAKSTITIKLFDDRALRDPALGTAVIRLDDLLQAKDRQQDWFPLSGARSGKLRITTDWKPLLLPGSVGGTTTYTPPIGVMRIWLKKAVDLKNVESGLGGKSDPYVRVLLNHQVLAKTEVIDNNLNPEFDEIVYIPVHHTNDNIVLEIMDHQNLTKDRHLGTVELKVSEYVLVDQSNNETPYMSSGGKDRADAVLLGTGANKGRLHYHASFVPGVALQGGVHFEPVAEPSKVLANEPLNMPVGESDKVSIRTANGDASSIKEPEVQPGVSMGIGELLQERMYPPIRLSLLSRPI